MRPQWSHSKSGYIFETPYYLFCVDWRVLQLSQLISDFRVYTQDLWHMRPGPQWSHSKSGYIFEKPQLFCVEYQVSQLSKLLLDFECIPRVLVLKRTQKLHEFHGDIFEKAWIVCVECNALDSLLDYRLGKKPNWQLVCHGCTVDNFHVCIKMILPKSHLNVPLSYPVSRTSKFYEWLKIKCDKCNMIVIALQLVSLITLWSTFLYVLHELIKLVHGFVNHIRSSVRNHLGTWYSAIVRSPKRIFSGKGGDVIIATLNLMILLIVGRLYGFKIITLTFFTSLPIQSAYGSNSQDLFQTDFGTWQHDKILVWFWWGSFKFQSQSVSKSWGSISVFETQTRLQSHSLRLKKPESLMII